MKLENQDEIVISGVGGYFPKSINMDVFKQGLLSNESLLESRWPAGEMGVTNMIGKMPDIEYFDCSYFGIHRDQCNLMDTMQRLVLERTFEALIDAGVNPKEIRGKKVGVYTGATIGENDNLLYQSNISGFAITGYSRSMMANRISYWLNLKGPSCAYDSNWLNGVEVLQAAYDAVRTGQCDSAIAATANLALNCESSWLYNDMGLLSADATTRSFDANANGYGRSDGVVVLYIQRACDAKRVYATVLGVNSHYNGNRNGPYLDWDADAMATFMRDFYTNCKVNPRDVEFVECYGAAHCNIDEAELTAIDRVYCKNRNQPLLVGSVKSNTGHAEASSIMMSLVKVLIAMESGVIPANINYETPNPNIHGLVEGRIEVVNTNKKWNNGLAAINGIGLTSSYGHILLKSNPKVKKRQPDELPRLIVISTRTEQGIQAILTSLKSEEKVDPEYAGLIQDTFNKPIAGHLYRGYAVLDGTEQAKTDFGYYPGNKRQVWFVYSGMGSQWCKMAVDLMVLPIFAAAIHRCHKVLEPKGIDLLKIVTEDDEKMFENILHSFVGIAAVQIGLTDVLHSLGITPDGIIGHSVGELGCAYADGCLTADQMIMCAYSRGRATLEADLIRGMMAAIGMGYQQIKDQCPPSIEVACHNGPDSCTISGPTEDMEIFVKDLQDRGVFARLVNVSNIAYHSKYIKPAAPLLLKSLQEVIPEPVARSSKWVSTSIPEEQWGTDLAKTSSAEYHTNNLLSSVLFEEGSKRIPQDSVLIEIAPHGLLQAILKRSLSATCTNVPLTHKTSKNGLNFLLGAIGKMYLAGLDLNIPALYPKVDYPVSRGTKSLTPLIHWEHGEKWRGGLDDKRSHLASTRNLNISLKNEEYKDFIGNQIRNTVVIPISAYLANLISILNVIKEIKITDVILENLKFKTIVQVPTTETVPLCITVQKGGGKFEISSGNELIGTGHIKIPESKNFLGSMSKIKITKDALQLTGNDVYSEFYHRGHKNGGIYKVIKNLNLTEEGSVGSVAWNNNWLILVEAMLQQCLFQKGEHNQNTVMISSIQRIALSLPLLPTEATDIEVTYEYATGIISTEGIHISGVCVKPLEVEHHPISYDILEFTPLANMEFINIESGINLGLHIIMENFENHNASSIMIVEIETDQPVLEQNIRNVLDKYTQLSANISSVKDSKMILISETEPLYVITNSTMTEDCVKLLTSSHAFLLAQTDKNIISNPQVTQVAQFSVNGISYSLFRKSSKVTPLIVQTKGDTLSSKDLLREDVSWVSQLKSAVAKAKDETVYLVSSVVPFEGTTNFLQNVRALPSMVNVRFVFILDKKAPEFTAKEPIYQQVFKNDLTLVVIKDGCVGSYIPIPTEFTRDVSNTMQTTSNIIANTRIDYLGINVRDETLMLEGDRKPELGNIDYSGVSSSGQKIMGLAHLDVEFCKLVPDPVLCWSFPSRWSLEDAATVPHAYSIAYYALVIAAKTKPRETILVHGGCSAFGIAAISIASTIGCTIFTTVTSDKQKAFMKKQFEFLNDRNIFNACTTSFEPHLMMATGGDGVRVILNSLSGCMLNATLRCVADFGKIILMGKLDIEENNEIGMRMFLKNVSLGGVTAEDIFNAPIEVKQQVHDLVEQGINNLTVRPLYRAVVEHQDIKSILRTLKQPEHIGKILIKLSDNLALSQLNINKTSQFICDPKSSYLVYGGSSEMWIDVLEWLIFRGARGIVVSSESKPQQAHINRRLTLLQAYYNAEIIFSPTQAQTRESTSELLSKVYCLGPIGAVVILPNNDFNFKSSKIKAVQYLDSALKTAAPKALLINLFMNATGVCQQRADAGFPTHNVQWENTLEFSDILFALDDILRFKAKDIFIKDDQFKDTIQETAQSLYKKLSLLFPTSIDQLLQETAIAPRKLDFFQLPTLCARVMREVAPVFVIPGMFGRNAVKDLASQLLHPVFCANFPTASVSLQKTAEALAQRVKEIHPKGPYNLIGISYGGVLAIEIAKILERGKAKTITQLLDCAPDTIQGVIKHLGEGTNSEIGILCRILNLTNPDIVKGLSSLSGWEPRLKLALRHCDYSSDDKVSLTETLTTFKKYFDEIATYQPSEDLLVGSVSLIRPSGANKYDVCGLPKYYKQNAEVNVSDGNYATMLKQKSTISFINNKVIS